MAEGTIGWKPRRFASGDEERGNYVLSGTAVSTHGVAWAFGEDREVGKDVRQRWRLVANHSQLKRNWKSVFKVGEPEAVKKAWEVCQYLSVQTEVSG